MLYALCDRLMSLAFSETALNFWPDDFFIKRPSNLFEKYLMKLYMIIMKNTENLFGRIWHLLEKKIEKLFLHHPITDKILLLRQDYCIFCFILTTIFQFYKIHVSYKNKFHGFGWKCGLMLKLSLSEANTQFDFVHDQKWSILLTF